MTQSELQVPDFEKLPQVASSRLIDFDPEKTEVRPGIVNGTYILIVRGNAPYLNMKVNLVPLVHIRQPEYWGIEVTGTLSDGFGLTALEPYTVSLSLNGTIGTQGIEVIGTNTTKKIQVPQNNVANI